MFRDEAIRDARDRRQGEEEGVRVREKEGKRKIVRDIGIKKGKEKEMVRGVCLGLGVPGCPCVGE